MKKIIFGVSVLIATSLVVADLFVLPFYIKTKLGNLLSLSCPACQVHLGKIAINPFTNQVTATNVTFINDPKSKTAIRISIAKVSINTEFKNLGHTPKIINQLDLQGFDIVIEESFTPENPPKSAGDLEKLEATYGGKFLEGLPELKVDAISLKDSSLTYILHIFEKDAQIKVSEIDASISKMGTRKGLCPKYISTHLTGRVQKTGFLKLNLEADLFSIKNQDRINISIVHQNMSDLDSFFTNEDGIEMGGEIEEIHANFRISQGSLGGSLWAHYHNLSFHMIPTPQAGKLKVFFENIVQGLKIAKTKPRPNKPPPVAFISYNRKPNESIIEFILQGLKEAAFKLISN